jgi:hypothetical protein
MTPAQSVAATPVPGAESRKSEGCASKPVGEPNSTVTPDWGAVAFVWGIWLLLLVGALAFVLTYGSYVPFMDEWESVPVLTGEQPVTIDWLWAQHSEHVVPLPRILLLAMYKLSGGDFHIGLVANVLALGALALAMILLAKRLRGQTSYLDAFFPLVLLNLDQELIFIALCMNIIVSTTLAGIVFLVVMRQGREFALGNMILAGICVVLLTFSGSSGVALVPALGLWLGYVAVAQWHSRGPQGRRNSLLLGGLTAAALVLVPVYFGSFQRNPGAVRPDLWSALQTSLEFLSQSFGQAAGHFLSDHPIQPYFGVAVLLLMLLSGALLIGVVRKQPHERRRALGLLMFLGAVGCLAVGIGAARVGRGYAPRYVSLAVPALYCVYFIWELYGSANARRLIQMVLFTVICMLFPLSWQETLQRGVHHGQQMAAVEKDVAAGTSPTVLAERYGSFLYDPDRPETLAAYLRMLHHAGIGPFRQLRDDPDVREVLFPVVPKERNQVTWKDGRWKGDGQDPYLVFALQQPQFIYAVRIKISYESQTDAPTVFQMFWRRSDQNEFVEEERNHVLELKTVSGERTVTVPVNDTIDQFRIDPDTKPCVFKLSEIMLLVPPADYARLRDQCEEIAALERLRKIREVVGGTLPPGATVLVVSKGDDDLLKLDGRKAWHFPQTADGEYAGKPTDSAEAIAQLEALRGKGGQYLLFPETAVWWLDYYKEFKQHLDAHYRRIYKDGHCIIYQLSAAGACIGNLPPETVCGELDLASGARSVGARQPLFENRRRGLTA